MESGSQSVCGLWRQSGSVSVGQSVRKSGCEVWSPISQSVCLSDWSVESVRLWSRSISLSDSGVWSQSVCLTVECGVSLSGWLAGVQSQSVRLPLECAVSLFLCGVWTQSIRLSDCGVWSQSVRLSVCPSA